MLRARLMLLFAVVIWGWTFVATKICLLYLRPIEVMGLQFLIALPVLLSLIVVNGVRLDFRGYRGHAEALRLEVQNRALAMAKQGKSTEEIVEFVGRTLLNKLLHTPTRRLRQAGEEGDEELLRAAQQLLGGWNEIE